MSVKRVACSALFVPESDVSDGDNGFIYVIGGRTDDKVRTKLCEKYNIEKKKVGADFKDECREGKSFLLL